MKKIIAIATLLFYSTISYGQTKEETITWLKEKLNKYIYLNAQNFGGKMSYNLKLESIDECYFTYSYDIKVTRSDGEADHRTYIIPTKGIMINRDSFGYASIIFKNDVITHTSKIKPNELKRYLLEIYIINGEDDIFNRLIKGFEHLSTFCPKTKETF